MVKRTAPARTKRRKPRTSATLGHQSLPDSAAIDALFDAFAHNLARKLASRVHGPAPRPPSSGDKR